MSDDLRSRVARVIDPDAFFEGLFQDGSGAYWHTRRSKAFQKADAALAEIGGVRDGLTLGGVEPRDRRRERPMSDRITECIIATVKYRRNGKFAGQLKPDCEMLDGMTVYLTDGGVCDGHSLYDGERRWNVDFDKVDPNTWPQDGPVYFAEGDLANIRKDGYKSENGINLLADRSNFEERTYSEEQVIQIVRMARSGASSLIFPVGDAVLRALTEPAPVSVREAARVLMDHLFSNDHRDNPELRKSLETWWRRGFHHDKAMREELRAIAEGKK